MLCHIGKLVQFYYGGSAPQRRDLVRLLPSDLVGVVWGGEGLVV